jgi:hypothetical protein
MGAGIADKRIGASVAALCTALALGCATPSLAKPKAPIAPATKAVAKLPDWSGVWLALEGKNIDPTTETRAYQPNAPLNAKYKALYEQSLAARVAGKPTGDIGCLPEGPPRIMRADYPFELVVTPKQTWMLFEIKTEIRRIYTDGRKPPADLDPTFEGYSTGHWEGDTLVFDTVGLKAGTIDSGGLIHTDALTLHERVRKTDPDTIEDRLTMTEPNVFTKPWTVVRHYKRKKDWEIKEYICAENNRNPINDNGETGVALKNDGKK